MGKRSGHKQNAGLNYAKKQQIKRAAEASMHRRFAIQFLMDGVAIGLYEHLGLKGQELVDCINTIVEWIMKVSELTNDDAKDDKEIVYTKDQIDRRLQDILPSECFVPWDVRMSEALKG